MDKLINWLKGLSDPGKKVAKVVHGVKKTSGQLYDQYIKPTADRINGLRPLAINVTREKDELDTTQKKQTIFVFDNVEIIDHEKIRKQLEEGKEPAVVATPAEKPSLYSVKLAIDNPDTRIGEIDFSDWDRSDFHLTVTKKGPPPKNLDPTKDKIEYDKILNTLKKTAKVSAAYPTLSPNDPITEVGVNRGVRAAIGAGIGWFRSAAGGGLA